MSSLLTNSAASGALLKLKNVNRRLDDTRLRTTTGLEVASAQDDAARWGIATTMRGDVDGFKQVSANLAAAQSTLAVARAGAETVSDLLIDMKAKLAEAANGDRTGADRLKIAGDIDGLRAQIVSTVDAAQFNGINLLNGSGDVSFITSLSRNRIGDVTAQTLTVSGTQLELTSYTSGLNAVTTFDTASGGNVVLAPGASETVTFGGDLNASPGETYSITLGGRIFSYINKDNETAIDIAPRLKAMIEAGFAGQVSVEIDDGSGGGLGDLVISNNSADDLSLMAQANDSFIDGFAASQFSLDLARTAIPEQNFAVQALAQVEAMIDHAARAAAYFGSQQQRVVKQSEFVSKLTGALQQGVGTLVDADMEQEAARSQALSVQQQLGVQSLAQANQAPQALLALFR